MTGSVEFHMAHRDLVHVHIDIDIISDLVSQIEPRVDLISIESMLLEILLLFSGGCLLLNQLTNIVLYIKSI